MSKSRVNDAAFINVSVICHLFLFVVLVYIFHRHLKRKNLEENMLLFTQRINSQFSQPHNNTLHHTFAI